MDIYNLTLQELENFVKEINYGYIDIERNVILDSFSNPNNNYLLQSKDELLKSKTGLCFDIVELYRDYFHKKGYQCEAYFLYYNDLKYTEAHSFIIYKGHNKLWYECEDNSFISGVERKGYHEKEFLVKKIYEWFQEYVETNIKKTVDKCNFYMTKYDYPEDVIKNKTSLEEYLINPKYYHSNRVEYSGMSIVFCKDKVLLLETKHNEFVFPKGHIEKGETSKDASIRECKEESGVDISNSKYLGRCGNYSYTFSAGHLRIPNYDFYKTFEINSITKNIYVHVYVLDDFQEFSLEPIFIHGIWVNTEKATKIITHKNTLKIYYKALKMYKKAAS